MSMRPRHLIALAAVAACACACAGTKGRGPEPTTGTAGMRPQKVSAEQEQLLDRAVKMKRSGDVDGAFQLVESLPPDSPARLDNRYDEITAAWSDKRTKQIGEDFTLHGAPTAIGGGPQSSPSTPSGEPAPPTTGGNDAMQNAPHTSTLDSITIDRLVQQKQAPLRNTCYANSDVPTSFILAFHIDANGNVRDPDAVDVRGDETVARCVRAQVRRWTFPASAEGGDYTVRMIFRR